MTFRCRIVRIVKDTQGQRSCQKDQCLLTVWLCRVLHLGNGDFGSLPLRLPRRTLSAVCPSSASKTTSIFAGSGVRVLVHKMLANGRLEETLACLLMARNCACPRTLLGQQSDNFWDQYDSYIIRNWRATALLR